MTIEIKNRFTGKVILSIDTPNLRYANLRYANLRYADLRGVDLLGADLRGADLRYADLRGVDLRYADLRYADLRYANLQGVDLRWANLQGANLRGVDLQGADIAYCIGDGKIIRTMQTPKYQVVVCDDRVRIGCKGYRLHEWKSFNDDEITAMDVGALEWWNANKVLVFAFVDADGMGE